MKFTSIRILYLFFSLVFTVDCAYSQERLIEKNDFGVYLQAGLSAQIGSHQNRLGLKFSATVGQSYANLKLLYHLLYTFQDLGYYQKSLQHIAAAQLSAAFQKKSISYRATNDSPFGNHFFYEAHYQYRYYFNRWETQQPTGEIGLRFGHFFLKHENDLLAAKSVDKFRTAAMRVGYSDSVQQIATSFIFWTGNKDAPKTKRINESKFSRYGYFDLSETALGKYSHGILAVDYQRELPFSNQLRLSVGYDDERIRNIIQNKFMHDLPIWPRKWNTAKSRHVPMVDQEGNAFLYRKGQKLREGKFYWGLLLNSPAFY